MTTKSDTEKTLTHQQLVAVDALSSGANVTGAAKAAGVTRQTCSEWLNRSAEFQSALDERRAEMWRESVVKARALVPRALEIVEDELSGDRRFQAARLVLSLCGFGESVAPKAGAQGGDLGGEPGQTHAHMCGYCGVEFRCGNGGCATFELGKCARCCTAKATAGNEGLSVKDGGENEPT